MTQPNKPPKLDKGEIEIRYPDGSRVYIRLNPKRFRVVRSLPAVPRKWEVDMPTGTRNVQPVEDGEITATPPTTPQPESITPSEHPAPTPAPTPAPQPKPKPSKGKKKAKAKKKPTKPARKTSKKKAKKKSRR